MARSEIQTPQAEIIFVLGGARSGKSAFAQTLASASPHEKILFLATAEPLDDEMRERIAKHRAQRPAAWQTLEAPRDLPRAIAQLPDAPQLIVVDCLTLWVTNELLASAAQLERRLLCQMDLLMEWTRLNDVDLVLISNEVGLGIVPENALARRFRDLLGIVNAHVAQNADKVFWMAAGLALELKSKARAPQSLWQERARND